MTLPIEELRRRAVAVLQTAGAKDKARQADGFFENAVCQGPVGPPARPARPLKPSLAPPGKARRRSFGSEAGRAALLHAIAHIELNAIDLAFDMAARFTPQIAEAGLDERTFINDWIRIGMEEARHFGMICDRLSQFGTCYGDLPAHDGLWEAAESTADDVLARLAIAPMVLEARGLDVTPGMIAKLESQADLESAEILRTIYRDEIGHVAAGTRWFNAICEVRNIGPEQTFKQLVASRFNGPLKPPFNQEARQKAGLPPSYYGR